MASYYQECGEEVAKLAQQLMEQFHPELVKCDASITFLFAFNADGHAIMHNSWPAKAIVKVTTLRDRVAGLRDVLMIIDGEYWKESDKKARTSLVDHELTHLNPKYDKVGAVKYDDANRPKLFCKPHDFQFGGFHQMVQRYSADSDEAKAINFVIGSWTQRNFEWMSESAAVGT